jgi:hypothetical protein
VQSSASCTLWPSLEWHLGASAFTPSAVEGARDFAERKAHSIVSSDSVHWGSVSEGALCEAPRYAGTAGIGAGVI